jgi:hypothetical protein
MPLLSSLEGIYELLGDILAAGKKSYGLSVCMRTESRVRKDCPANEIVEMCSRLICPHFFEILKKRQKLCFSLQEVLFSFIDKTIVQLHWSILHNAQTYPLRHQDPLIRVEKLEMWVRYLSGDSKPSCDLGKQRLEIFCRCAHTFRL